jgi:predicted nucleic acid-binding Zn ribbon protein
MSDLPHTDLPWQVLPPDNGAKRQSMEDVTPKGVTANKKTLRSCHVCSSSVTEQIAFRTGGSATRFVCAADETVIDDDGDIVRSCVSRFMRWEAAYSYGGVSGDDKERWEREWWHLLGSCAICAVPVYANACTHNEGRYDIVDCFESLPYCSEQCRRALISQRAKAERAAKRGERPCEACGRLFIPTRADAKTCSNRCRQAAHRQRKRGAAVWLSDMMRADGELPYLKEDK